METQIKALYKTPQGVKLVTIFGYATKGVPSLEINGVGKLSKNIKEKLIYLTRNRRLQIPLRRFVICIDLNELNDQNPQHLKWLEFPLLLMYWYLSGLIPISKLDNCIASGWVKTNGEIFHMTTPLGIDQILRRNFNPVERKSLKFISLPTPGEQKPRVIDSSLLLEHIPDLNFRMDYIESSSAMPSNSFIA